MSPETPKNTAQAIFSHSLSVEALVRQGSGTVNVAPDPQDIVAIRDTLGLRGLRKVTLKGDLKPHGDANWRLIARLGATITQECVVTLGPVTTRIEERIERVWVIEMPEPSEATSEEEIPEDTNTELLGKTIELGHVLIETLGLALPPYPRATDAVLEQSTFSGPGITPMQDEDTRPFAGLAGLRDKIAGQTDTEKDGS